MPIHILQDGLLPETFQGGKGAFKIDKWDMIPRSFSIDRDIIVPLDQQ